MARENAVICDSLGLTSIPSIQSFGGTPIKYLSITGDAKNLNNIPKICRNDFQGASAVTSMAISWSQVRSLEDEVFAEMPGLKTLALSDNELQSLSAATFSGITSLRQLDLSGNKHCSFDETMFTHIPNITVLVMGDMNLQTLKETFFESLMSLRVLKLYSNNIKTLPENLIVNLANLESLDLASNQLQTVPVQWKPKFLTMTQVHLAENPLQCNCLLSWLREMPGHLFHSALDSSSVVCNGPQKLRYASFANVHDKDFLCIPPKVLRCAQTKYSIDINQRLSIVCKFDGDPVPEIKWTRPDGHEYDGRNTSDGAYEVTQNGTLIVNGVTMSDYGEWKVMAYNKTAYDEIYVTVHVVTTTGSTLTMSNTTTTPKQTITKLTTPAQNGLTATATPELTNARLTTATTMYTANDATRLSGEWMDSAQTKIANDSGFLIGVMVTAAVISCLVTVGVIAYCLMKKFVILTNKVSNRAAA
ncbi:leucine-rich repeat and fibronectin type-III domain-containing protein 5-like [Dreissena polymorpha]|nr:leucine-rich repeat and fibronectin type-III domain-containing protein 5-like [Dreissena polymorpha]